ncbi:glycoside hydrolase [Aurantibacter crassamenti]|uniref:glycosyl hydrolase n=1 Tax=Aurantibacter crassamenti TaxID=1837375 RepID=UPI00193A8734|nr:glycosyl hydrolase [Aurantibacter crassamenti]MBM1105788.1 glycoside hydrolase [Aurantibacter crassamenti]
MLFIKTNILKFILPIITFLIVFQSQGQNSFFNEISGSNTAKPWTRWWWMGNAVDKEGIKQNLIAIQNAGLGGVEIAPIYGVKGEEDNYLKFLSPQWLEMLDYTIATADSLGLQVDMTLGTGWPYGGPQVTIENAATRIIVDSIVVKKGARFSEKIIPSNPKDTLSAKLNYVIAYGKDGSYLDLTSNLKDNSLNWKAKKTDYTLYKIFTGKTGQKVKRAAPGGQGYTVDHYSKTALEQYLSCFDKALSKNGNGLRAIFNDSYEVYHTDFTPNFFEHFLKNRGYNLKPHFQKLFSKSDTDLSNRIKSDYRETISDLLLTEFDEPWTAWANKRGLKSRLQAHGSPGNLIDYYAAADIPECETFGSMPYDIAGFRREKEDIREGDADPVMLKFSSSAAHISGKPLVSSETFTWLRDHFKSALSQCKPEAEDLLLSGVNHIFLHGSTYSPERAAWPGWKFYASVNFNKNNTIWKNASALFSYLENCQKLLQTGAPDNDVLLYWPIYDEWDNLHNGNLFFQFKIHSLDEWLHNTPFYNLATNLAKEGYGTDFISDRFVTQLSFENSLLKTSGGNYKSLIVPDTDNMPLATLTKLIELKKQGANIIFEGLPETVPGYGDLQEKNKVLANLISENKSLVKVEKSINNTLAAANIFPESIVDSGLKYIRRTIDGEKLYFLVNHTSKTINGNFPFQFNSENVLLYDPLSLKIGKANSNIQNNTTIVQLSIPSGGSLFLKTEKTSDAPKWQYFVESEIKHPIKGDWQLRFLEGGPELPEPKTLTTLESWTSFGNKEAAFSGTAQYETTFTNPDETIQNWKLKLGDVRESAKVWVNEKYIGTVWANPFEIQIDNLKKGQNNIRIEVTNLPANRIRAKEMRGEEWKIFHEINMVNKDYEKFDATLWKPTPSGLLNDVSLIPLKTQKEN